MMFLCGAFVPLGSMPASLPGLARLLPTACSVEALRIAQLGGATAALDLAMLALFSLVLFGLAVFTRLRRMD